MDQNKKPKKDKDIDKYFYYQPIFICKAPDIIKLKVLFKNNVNKH